MNFNFKWVDSDSKLTTMEQFYTEGDVAPLGRLNYVFNTVMPGTTPSEETVTESSTEVPTEAPTETTDVPAETTDAGTETPAKKGCGASLPAVLLPVTAACAATCARKKKEHE
jgi:hypothetical protein